MTEKNTPLALALSENLRLRLMLSALPDPRQGYNWQPDYIRWWFRNRHTMTATQNESEPAA